MLNKPKTIVMKKILPLILFCFSVFSFSAFAQTTVTCNANFTWNASGNTAKFLPDVIGDSPFVRHYWSFGDGHTSDVISPYNTFPAAGGTYTVIHYLIKKNPNGVELCRDSVTKVITLQADCVVPQFTYAVDAANYLTIKFTNTTYSINANDSVSWMFGDGTHSGDMNATHTYANAGTYKVCLLVKKRSTTPGTAICVREKCVEIVVARPCDIAPDFNWQKDPSLFNKVYFANTTLPLNTSDSIEWSFGDGTYSRERAPAHIYDKPGTYNVCLNVTRKQSFASDPVCSKVICKTLEIIAPTCTIVPNFTWVANPTLTTKVTFTNTTAGLTTADSVKWSFGDGTYSSDANPSHVYAIAGTYFVTMEVKKYISGSIQISCYKTITKEIKVIFSCNSININFEYQKDSTNVQPYTYDFINTSTPVSYFDSVKWSFGDGAFATDINPVHTYNQSGTYTVCLRIIKRNSNYELTDCVKELCKTIVIETSCEFVASYIAAVDATNSRKINFTNTTKFITANANAIATWSFGDGSPNVTGWNATHEYVMPGKYYVCLRVQYSNTCVKYTCDSIAVTVPTVVCNFTPGYTWVKDAANSKKINFTNTTVLPTSNASVNWNFGDGTANVISWNAIHEYATPGKYYVCLRIEYGTGCVKYKCDSVTVTVPPPVINCNELSLFTFQPSSVNKLYYFTPVNKNTDVQYIWTFGDGAGSRDMISSHQFAEYGNYIVCLTAFKNANCAYTTCKEIKITPPVNCDTVKLTYGYRKDQYMSNKFYFYPISNVPVQQQTWTIIKRGTGNTITVNQNNPLYGFSDTGYYYVCLRAVTNGGCVKEYCSVIHIESISTRCELQAAPNPVTNLVNITVQMDATELIHVYVYNLQNVLVQQKKLQGVAGNNIVNINTEGLPAGYYTIKLIYGNKICFAKFQKI